MGDSVVETLSSDRSVSTLDYRGVEYGVCRKSRDVLDETNTGPYKSQGHTGVSHPSITRYMLGNGSLIPLATYSRMEKKAGLFDRILPKFSMAH